MRGQSEKGIGDWVSDQHVNAPVERRAILVTGNIQGVGFRPFVYNLAVRNKLAGFVQNQINGVLIEVQGTAAYIEAFLRELTPLAPPLARIGSVQSEYREPIGEQEFRIQPSQPIGGQQISIPADAATCEQCLAELFDSADRRYHYPFLSCTNCGPRFTIIESLPFDRERTTMSAFALCAECRREYEDPRDRRFHAQTLACAACGPQLKLLDAEGTPIATPDPIVHAAELARSGKIGALKGLGGFHLFCDAGNSSAVDLLRHRKGREQKPFAVMVADLARAKALCEITPEEEKLLTSPQAPIVLLRKRPGGVIAGEVAPGNPRLGIFLPYTPLHHLLLRELRVTPLVMTSGNSSEEPIVYQDDEFVSKLGCIADFFLTHDREIRRQCDDSVLRMVGIHRIWMRRSRGYAPACLIVPMPSDRRVLAVGGQLNATFSFGRNSRVMLSHHIGDLGEWRTYQAFSDGIGDYERLAGAQPECIAHDLHPDYMSTRYALARAAESGVTTMAVQHHHAHIAGCMAESDLTGPVIGVAFDGTGYGTDGAIWGGEFLVGDFNTVERAAHLRYVAMPGGEQAVREPWRMAISYLLDAALEPREFNDRIPVSHLETVRQMVHAGINCPLTSSCGRLFDALASILGLCDRSTYEGQPAMELEWIASDVPDQGSYRFGIESSKPLIVDTRPLVLDVVNDLRAGISKAVIARRIHSTIVEIVWKVCCLLREKSGLKHVGLSGGVFMNAILLEQTMARLTTEEFEVHCHRLLPPGDGGLCLGQLAVAAARLRATERVCV